MPPVAVRILHAEAGSAAGPLERALIGARSDLAERHRRGFLAAGATDVRVVAGPPDGIPFGARLRGLAVACLTGGKGGLVVLGSGAMPLATAGDRRAFVLVARGPGRAALANNVYSADVVALGGPTVERDLRDLPDLPADNALPRWLAEVGGWRVAGLERWRLGIDLDSPLDLLLVGRAADMAGLDHANVPREAVAARLAGVAAILADRRAELVGGGTDLGRDAAGARAAVRRRVRALIEERGLRACQRSALGGGPDGPLARPPRSTLGLLVDRDGPEALGSLLAGLGDAAVVDTRVLIAHRFGRGRGAPGRRPRIASPPTCSCPTGSPIRGCAP